jgi:hypothetical protein
VPDRPGLTLIFWIFVSTGVVMLASYVAWRRHDKRNAARHHDMTWRRMKAGRHDSSRAPYSGEPKPKSKDDDEIEDWEI